MKNEYTICDDYIMIHLNTRDGKLLYAYVDIEDFDRIKNFNYKWFSDWRDKLHNYYCRATIYLGIINGKPKYDAVYLHRFVLGITYDIQIDHLNHNTLDNRKSNLMPKTRSENMINRKSRNSNNTSGERNVSWSKGENKWLVQLQVSGKNTCFGRFHYDELDKAIELARIKRKEIYGKKQEFVS